MLEIQNLVKSYGSKEILHGISLDVKDGEIFGFIGHNGAGKTTTIKSAIGIVGFDSGQILIDGIDVSKNPIEAKKRIAYLPDNPDIYENLTGIQYLNFISNIFQIDQATRQKKIEEFGKELEIFDYLGDQIKSLSHGMKQKVAVIGAFIHEPRLLVLDEPFVGLDPKASFILKNKMKQLCEQGSSVFFSSHVLEVVSNLCNHIAIIKGGNIIRDGETVEILSHGQTLEELFLDLENDYE